jgi:hypothetical protein
VSNQTKTRATAGLAGVITGVLLIGSTGLTFIVGWVLWGIGLCVLLAAVPAAGEKGPRSGHRESAPARRFSLVR